MKSYTILIFLLLLSCGTRKESNENLFKEKILSESFYTNGRSKIKVVKGRTPGEDTYLKILNYDSLGKLSLEYGALHYGRKYKTAYRYNLEGKLIEELVYSFDTLNGQFENYLHTYHDYTIKDTLANFNGYVSLKVIYSYSKGMNIQKTFELSSDSLNENNHFIPTSIDTLYDELY